VGRWPQKGGKLKRRREEGSGKDGEREGGFKVS
jgi:hypothetical protein